MDPVDRENAPEPRETSASTVQFSTATQIAAIVGVVAVLAAGMLWLSGQRKASSTNGATPATVAGPTSQAPDSSSEIAEADAQKPTKAPKPKPPEKPKVILDWIEYSSNDCDLSREVGVNVIEQRGQVDSVTLVWRAKEEDTERKRRLYRNGKQWTSYLQGVPNDTDVQLLAIAEGPGGQTTLGANISRYC